MIIFNISGDFHGIFSSLPNESYLDESKWIIAEFAEGEEFDSRYSYSPVDGVAVKGELIPIDTVEEARIQAEWESQEYSRKRKPEYDQLNQDEMRYDDLKNGTNTWEQAIDAIKAKYPKPTE